MSHHFIYLPQGSAGSGTPADRLRALGLDNHASGFDAMPLPTGPDGEQNPGGLLLGWLTPSDARFGFAPSEQKWMRSAEFGDREAGAYWVGFWRDRPPTEERLRLPRTLRHGIFHEMGGDRWKFPTRKSIERVAQLRENGILEFEAPDHLSWFVTDCEKRALGLQLEKLPTGKVSIQFAYNEVEMFLWLCRAMALNYRITPEVITHLRLFTDHTMGDLYVATLDIDQTTLVGREVVTDD